MFIGILAMLAATALSIGAVIGGSRMCQNMKYGYKNKQKNTSNKPDDQKMEMKERVACIASGLVMLKVTDVLSKRLLGNQHHESSGFADLKATYTMDAAHQLFDAFGNMKR